MTFAEEKTYKYIYQNHSRFCRVDVLEILPLLSCLTASDQSRLRASYTQLGNQDTLWDLFNRLQRRAGWVGLLIMALRNCNLPDLADEVARVYQSYLPPGTPPCSSVPPEMSTVPANVPGTSASAPGHRTPHNGYRDQSGYPMPVQDTQPPMSPGESLEQTPQARSSGAVLRMSGGSLGPSSNPTASSPLTSGGYHEQNPELGSTHPTGAVSSTTPSCGPLSPTVSFQPLVRSTPRASHVPGPTVSVLPPESSFPSSSTDLVLEKETCDQDKIATCPSDAVKPTNSVTTISVPSSTNLTPVNTVSSKVPANPGSVNTMPSKLLTISKPPGAMPSNVLTSPAPSKSHTNLIHPNAVSSKVPTGIVSTKAPVNSVPSNVSSSRTKEMQEAPETTVTTGDSLPGPNSSSRNFPLESMLSKPGVLLSENNELVSISSEDLAISPSNSLVAESRHGPEEDEYVSFNVQVHEDPSVELLEGSPGLVTTKQLPEKKTPPRKSVSWVQWLGAASSLLAVLMAILLYRRRLAQ